MTTPSVDFWIGLGVFPAMWGAWVLVVRPIGARIIEVRYVLADIEPETFYHQNFFVLTGDHRHRVRGFFVRRRKHTPWLATVVAHHRHRTYCGATPDARDDVFDITGQYNLGREPEWD